MESIGRDWYLRTAPGKPVQGPFDQQQLERYVAEGRLRPTMEVSHDTVTWSLAADIGLFAGTATGDTAGFRIRIRGKQSGPHDEAALAAMVRHGKLLPIHEVSRAGGPWQPASAIGGLFASRTSAASESAPDAGAAEDPGPAAQPSDAPRPTLVHTVPIDPIEVLPARVRGWYYSIAGAREGPVGKETLVELVRRGVLTADDLVRADDMDDWIAAARVPELAAADRGRGRRRSRRVDARDASLAPRAGFEVGPLQVMAGILLVLLGAGQMVVAGLVLVMGSAMADAAAVLGMAFRQQAMGVSAVTIGIGLVLLMAGVAVVADGVGLFLAKRWALIGLRAIGAVACALQLLGALATASFRVAQLVGIAIAVFLLAVGVLTPVAGAKSRPTRART